MVQTLQPLRPNGFEIFGVPCNQFGGQEPGTPQQIRATADKYGVEFQMLRKTDVNGVNCHPLYNYLRRNSELYNA